MSQSKNSALSRKFDELKKEEEKRINTPLKGTDGKEIYSKALPRNQRPKGPEISEQTTSEDALNPTYQNLAEINSQLAELSERPNKNAKTSSNEGKEGAGYVNVGPTSRGEELEYATVKHEREYVNVSHPTPNKDSNKTQYSIIAHPADNIPVYDTVRQDMPPTSDELYSTVKELGMESIYANREAISSTPASKDTSGPPPIPSSPRPKNPDQQPPVTPHAPESKKPRKTAKETALSMIKGLGNALGLRTKGASRLPGLKRTKSGTSGPSCP